MRGVRRRLRGIRKSESAQRRRRAHLPLYICGKRSDPFPDSVRGCCPNDRLRAAGVNEAVWTSVRDLLLDSDAFAQELAAWVERQSTTPSDQDVRTRKAEGRLEELTRQRERLTDAYQTGALALDPFHTRIQALEANHAAAELALAEIKSEHLEVELVCSRALGAQEVISTLSDKLLDADFDTRRPVRGRSRGGVGRADRAAFAWDGGVGRRAHGSVMWADGVGAIEGGPVHGVTWGTSRTVRRVRRHQHGWTGRRLGSPRDRLPSPHPAEDRFSAKGGQLPLDIWPARG